MRYFKKLNDFSAFFQFSVLDHEIEANPVQC